MKDPSAFAIRMVDRVSVKGKSNGVEIYEVLDAETPERRAIKLATAALLRSGMEKYFCRDFKAARTAFDRACSESPGDVVPAMFLERCARYLQQPPSDDWDGIERLGQGGALQLVRLITKISINRNRQGYILLVQTPLLRWS